MDYEKELNMELKKKKLFFCFEKVKNTKFFCLYKICENNNKSLVYGCENIDSLYKFLFILLQHYNLK